MIAPSWTWRTGTKPFWGLIDLDVNAAFVVEQVDDNAFCIPLGFGFRYRPDGEAPITVDASSLSRTDLATIPRYLSGLVSRHGRHTPAALVHDQQITDEGDFEGREWVYWTIEQGVRLARKLHDRNRHRGLASLPGPIGYEGR